MAKPLLIFLACCAALVGAAYSLSPKRYEVSREIVINAQSKAIHPYIEDLKRWPEWTIWNAEYDSTLTYSYSGPEKGVDAASKWTGKDGPGSLLIRTSDPQAGVWYDMTFGEGNQLMKSNGVFQYYPVEGGTKVVWSNAGRLEGFTMRLMGYGMEMFMGPSFEDGLAGLKAAVEAAK